MTERWPEARRIFEDALDLAPAERAGFARGAAGGDAELLAEVLDLLQHASGPEQELVPPAAPDLASAWERALEGLRAGASVADFRLVRRIASGGMGTVWEAEQSSPRRRVALKTLRTGFASPSALRRFQVESEVLARLRHPNVAQVYASGVLAADAAGGPGGIGALPWFAMEFVEGARDLLQHAEQNGLDLRARVALFQSVCAAVQHGHERGVLHRDLKPGNILVDSSGTPKLIDYGVARAEGLDLTTLETQPGTLIGTLQYMAPEQLEGDRADAGVPSDVYALGVVLYELACGRPPHELTGRSLTDVARVLRDVAPRRPAEFGVRLERDLEAILFQALEKEPARRYASANALREDLGNWLAGRAVAARPPTVAYQLRVFARRHRALAAAIAATVLVSVAAAGVSVHYGWRATAAEKLSSKRFEEVRGLARSVLFELHDAIVYLPGATEARRALAAKALEYFDALERDAGDDAGLLEEIAEGRLRLGEVLGAPGHASLGDRAAGARELKRSIAVSERLLALRPDADAHTLHARAQLALGNFERAAGRHDPAMDRYTRCEEEAAAVAAVDPEDRTAVRLVLAARVQRAKVLDALGRSDDALALLRSTAEDLRAMRERWPDLIEPWRDSVIALDDLANAWLRRAKPAEALAALDEALTCAEEHQRRAPQDVRATEELGSVLVSRGRARYDLGDDDGAALADLTRAVGIQRDLLERDPSNTTQMDALAGACERLGVVRRALRDNAAALEAHEEALALERRLLERTPAGYDERLAVSVGEQFVAAELRSLGRAEEARAAVGRALDVLRSLEADHPDSLDVTRQLAMTQARAGDVARDDGRFDEALGLYAAATQGFARAVLRDPEHAHTRRMVMAMHCARGVAHKAAAEAAAGDERAAHYAGAIEAFEAALAEQPVLHGAGFLKAGDDEAVALVRADLETCRTAQREPGAAHD